jgi:hypothetical protein
VSTYALVSVRATRADTSTEVDRLARATGLHPDLVRRLIRLGAIEPLPGDATHYQPDAAARLARIVRLRNDLGLNYAGALLAGDLLARIDELERRLAAPRRTATTSRGERWTPVG